MTCAAALLLALVRMPIAASLAVVALVSLATPVFHGASSRLVAQSLKGDAYVLGRSLNNIAGAGAQLFGLALGGAAVAALGPRRALAVSALLYLGCALAVRIRLPRLRPTEYGGTPGGAVGERGAVRASLQGAGLLLRGRTVRRLMLAQWLPPAFVAGAEGLIVAYAGERHFAPGWYAVLMGCLPVGMLVGDLLVGRLLRPRGRERLVVPLTVLSGLPLIGFAAQPGVGVSSCLLLLAGFGYAYGLGLQRPFLDALPPEGRGQAFGLLGSGSMTLQGVGPVCLGSVAAGLGTGRRDRCGRRRGDADRRLDAHLAPGRPRAVPHHHPRLHHRVFLTPTTHDAAPEPVTVREAHATSARGAPASRHVNTHPRDPPAPR